MPHARKTSLIAIVMCVPLALLATGVLRAVILMPLTAAELDYELLDAGGLGDLADTLLAGTPHSLLLAAPGLVEALVATLLACGALWAVAAVAGMIVRRRWALRLVGGAWIAVFVASAVLAVVAFDAASAIAAAYKEHDPGAGDVAYRTFLLRWYWLRWAIPACCVAGGMLVIRSRGRTLALYNAGPAAAMATGDRVVENLRVGGSDRRFRRSWLSSALLHWVLIIAIPFLLTLRGCVSPYLVPYGRGEARVTRVMHVVKRANKPRKKYILRQNAAVYWDIPDLNESKVAQQVNEQTQLTHVADRNAVHGKMGAGGGKQGGWPDGVPGGKIRFIRMEYAGRDWDDGMDAASAADINFLNFLRQEVPFPVAHKSESHPVGLLARYPKGQAPPFVYMTGSEGINSTAGDRKVLREYLLDGGMLFADAGSSRWDREFRRFLQEVFPDKRLIDIPDDDEIFQMPYTFPNGAPPLWHHGGTRALGMKHKGRWIAFYHPGDMNDAWKTGRSGMDVDTADKAYQMGINVMYYAITRYLEQTRKYRK
jgi:hypothetical protein